MSTALHADVPERHRVIVSDAVRDRTPIAHVRRSGIGISFQYVEPVVAILDAAIIVGSSAVGGIGYQWVVGNPVGDVAPHAAYGLIGSLAYALAAYRCELYRLQGLLQRRRDYVRVAASWLWAVLAVSIVLFLLKRGADASRGSIISFAVLGSVALLSWRAAVKTRLRHAIDRGAVRGRRIGLLGAEEERAVVRPGELMPLCGLEEASRVRLPIGERPGPEQRRLQAAAIHKAMEHARKASAEEIILALPWGNKAQL